MDSNSGKCRCQAVPLPLPRSHPNHDGTKRKDPQRLPFPPKPLLGYVSLRASCLFSPRTQQPTRCRSRGKIISAIPSLTQPRATYKVISLYAESLSRKLGSGKMGKSVGQEPSGVCACGPGHSGVSDTVDSDLCVRKVPSCIPKEERMNE